MKRILLVSLMMISNFLYSMHLSKRISPLKTLPVHSRCNEITLPKFTGMMPLFKLNEVKTFNSSTKVKVFSRKDTNLVQERIKALKMQLDKENKEIECLEKKIDFSIEASSLFYSNLPRIGLLTACKDRKLLIEDKIFNLEVKLKDAS